MVSTNLLEFYQQLQTLGDVRVKDHMDTIELHFAGTVNTEALDDIVCDALFVDPIKRYSDQRGCILELGKRSMLRPSTELRLERSGNVVRYTC
jgi:hypothetical protein